MPEEMNQLIDEKEWDSPMEFLIGAHQECETIMVDKEGRIAFKGNQVHRNIEEDIENLLSGKPLSKDLPPEPIKPVDPFEEIDQFYQECKNIQND